MSLLMAQGGLPLLSGPVLKKTFLMCVFPYHNGRILCNGLYLHGYFRLSKKIKPSRIEAWISGCTNKHFMAIRFEAVKDKISRKVF